jgi:hypothetical protein
LVQRQVRFHTADAFQYNRTFGGDTVVEPCPFRTAKTNGKRTRRLFRCGVTNGERQEFVAFPALGAKDCCTLLLISPFKFQFSPTPTSNNEIVS